MPFTGGEVGKGKRKRSSAVSSPVPPHTQTMLQNRVNDLQGETQQKGENLDLRTERTGAESKKAEHRTQNGEANGDEGKVMETTVKVKREEEEAGFQSSDSDSEDEIPLAKLRKAKMSGEIRSGSSLLSRGESMMMAPFFPSAVAVRGWGSGVGQGGMGSFAGSAGKGPS